MELQGVQLLKQAEVEPKKRLIRSLQVVSIGVARKACELQRVWVIPLVTRSTPQQWQLNCVASGQGDHVHCGSVCDYHLTSTSTFGLSAATAPVCKSTAEALCLSSWTFAEALLDVFCII